MNPAVPAVYSMDEAAAKLHYEAATGVFTWRVKPSAKVKIGAVAGKVRADGYRIIKLSGVYWYAHRLAFELGYGRAPVGLVDHINGDRADNRLENLREVDPSQSSANQKLRSDNQSGFKGVQFHATHGLWCARIRFRGRARTIGYFKTAEEASVAYIEAARRLHGVYARAR